MEKNHKNQDSPKKSGGHNSKGETSSSRQYPQSNAEDAAQQTKSIPGNQTDQPFTEQKGFE